MCVVCMSSANIQVGGYIRTLVVSCISPDISIMAWILVGRIISVNVPIAISECIGVPLVVNVIFIHVLNSVNHFLELCWVRY